MKSTLPLLVGMALWIAHGLAGQVMSAVPSSREWIQRAWQTEDGLPNNDVNGIAQSDDGSMLFATRGGLARFDGLRLTQSPTDSFHTKSYSVDGVLMGRDGTMWTVCRGHLIARTPGKEPLAFPLDGITGSARLVAFFQAADHAVWLCFELGPIFRFAKGKLERVPVQEGFPRAFATTLCEDSRFGIWAAGQRILAVWRNGRIEKVTDLPGDSVYARICPARSGGLWVACGSRLYHYTEAEGFTETGNVTGAAPGSRVSALLEDQDGDVWFGSFGNGLFLWDGNSFQKMSLPNQDVWWLAFDRERNLWAATGGGGACRLRPRVLTMLSDPGSPLRQTARAFCMDTRGDIWVALQTNQIYARRAGQWAHLKAGEDWPGELATCVCADPAGPVWIGTAEQSLVRWDGSAFTKVPLPPKAGASRIRVMLVARDGQLWFSRGDVLVHGQPDRWTVLETGGGTLEICALAQDSSGRIWAANQKGTLFAATADKLIAQKLPELNGASTIRSLLSTPDGALWIGTQRGGMARLKDGKLSRITSEHGLWSDAVAQLVLDNKGRLWGGGDRGIFLLPLDALNAVADGRATHLQCAAFGRGEGVPSIHANDGYTPNTLVMPDGKLWFAARGGIVIADPSIPGTNLQPPQVSIEELRVNDKPFSLARPVEIPPGADTLRFEFAAMSYMAPESVVVRHRLEGVDTDWVNSGPSREAHYGGLRHGRYTLRVRAANNDGIWCKREAVLPFTIQPFFWENAWFMVAVGGVCFLTTIFITYRFSTARTRRQALVLQRQAEINAERTRIARDMHDQIGASLTRIALLADLAQREKQDAAAPVPDRLEQLARTARETTGHLDEIVWAIDPKHDHLDSLLEYLGQQAVQTLSAAGIRCRLDFPSQPVHRPLTAEFRHHFFLMMQEAQNNIIKHAAASEMQFKVEVTSKELEVTLTDDGVGFSDAAATSGNGLFNMRSRAADLGGSCQITSAPGKGTVIVFRLPWPVA